MEISTDLIKSTTLHVTAVTSHLHFLNQPPSCSWTRMQNELGTFHPPNWAVYLLVACTAGLVQWGLNSGEIQAGPQLT